MENNSPTINDQSVAILRYKEDDLAGILLTWFVQVTALAAAITFGVFSVLSWTAAEDAKAQANMANLLALAALCGDAGSQVSILGSGMDCRSLTPEAGQYVQYRGAKLL